MLRSELVEGDMSAMISGPNHDLAGIAESSREQIRMGLSDVGRPTRLRAAG